MTPARWIVAISILAFSLAYGAARLLINAWGTL